MLEKDAVGWRRASLVLARRTAVLVMSKGDRFQSQTDFKFSFPLAEMSSNIDDSYAYEFVI